jgi:cob(I)alamin adenosyltransferase
MNKYSITTQNGDGGTTGLIGDDRVSKSDPRPQAYGALDEASALIGVVRSKTKEQSLIEPLIRIQNHLYLISAELACPEEKRHLLSKFLDQKQVDWLNETSRQTESQLDLPRKFVLYGESELSAYLDLARAVVRRAERNVVELHHLEFVTNPMILVYLNRLSDYIYLLARHQEMKQGIAFRHPD